VADGRAGGFRWVWKAIRFTPIIHGPERLHIGKVEAPFLVINFCEIKNGARHDVIYVPLSVIPPCHSNLEFALKVDHK
jgi:hypothetical protein